MPHIFTPGLGKFIFLYYPEVPIVLFLVFGLAIRWFLVPNDQKRTEWLLVAAAFAIPGNAFAESIASALSRLRPLKYDQYIYKFDQWFGEPSFRLGQIAKHSRAFYDLTILATLASGQHYLFDLPCAVPYSWAIWAVTHRTRAAETPDTASQTATPLENAGS